MKPPPRPGLLPGGGKRNRAGRGLGVPTGPVLREPTASTGEPPANVIGDADAAMSR